MEVEDAARPSADAADARVDGPERRSIEEEGLRLVVVDDLLDLLMTAEDAFYAALGNVTIADLCRQPSKGGLTNLAIPS